MIKAVILDIDGIIIGEKNGFNSPDPHMDVTSRLKLVHKKGIPIVLCTAKPYYSIEKIIKDAALNNPHITDAGAVIIDPIDHIIIEKHVLSPILVKNILQKCLENNIYVESYTVDDYFIQQNQISDITKKHMHILQRKPIVLQDVCKGISTYEITKILPIARNQDDKVRIYKILEVFTKDTSFSWAVHPIALPLQFGIITSLGSSKKEAVITISKNLHASLDTMLGVGDSQSDWKFIEICGYAGTLENGSKELKDLIKTKYKERYFIGPSVDSNGILKVFDYFSL